MIRSDARVAAKVVDHSMVLPVLRGAKAVLALTAEEEHDIRQQAGTAATVIRLGNGITPTDLRARWATPSPEVIFCSRLHERKRPEAFVEMSSELVSRGLNARFTLVGPDSGSLQPTIDLVRRLGLQGHVTFGGALAPGEVRRRLAAAQVFVLPSFAEPYPMAVLEAVSVGLPAVITHDTGISDLVSNRPGVAVTDGTPTELADAVERFLYDRDHWARASLDAVRLSADVFDARQVTLQLRSVYRR
jgi:glycosyltransferase involved in cell wall biosynthesis